MNPVASYGIPKQKKLQMIKISLLFLPETIKKSIKFQHIINNASQTVFSNIIWYTDHSNGWKWHTSSSTDHGICGAASELHNSYYCKNGLTNILV